MHPNYTAKTVPKTCLRGMEISKTIHTDNPRTTVEESRACFVDTLVAGLIFELTIAVPLDMVGNAGR